jgi:allophanate hydrolase
VYKTGCFKVVRVAGASESDQEPLAAQAWITRAQQPIGGGGGILAGLRFAAKDNIDVAGLPTTAGCRGFAYEPSAHAAVVQRLLEAGALLEGKTNLDQFACG